MEPVSVDDLFPSRAAVFVDNTLIRSAIRVLSGGYDGEDIRMFPDVPAALFVHDLTALASLCEAIVLNDEIFVNNLFSGIWSASLPSELGQLEEIVQTVALPPEYLQAATDALLEVDGSSLSMIGEAADLPDLIYSRNHYGMRLSADLAARAFVNEGHDLCSSAAGHVRASQLVNGTAFYLFSSDLLGVPYRPSPLRASVVGKYFSRQLRRQVLDPGEILERVLRTSEEQVLSDSLAAVRSQVERSLNLNGITLALPDLFLFLLSKAQRPSDVARQAFALRQSDEAAHLRWSLGELVHEIANGELDVVGRRLRDFEGAARSAHTALGLDKSSMPDIDLQWSPLNPMPTISVQMPRTRDRRSKRSLRLLRAVHYGAMTAAPVNQLVRRLFIDSYPDWLQDRILKRYPN